ncbi:MAG: nucleoside triphosphate pyrophosphohydrolase [Chloroflexota bacterium]|nr:nucleoside triphosphate pyrophosphohydrolase [Chloroflexota bacterium]
MITVVGLGPGGPEFVTRQAAAILTSAKRVYLRTRRHPAVAIIPPAVEVETFDDDYDRAESFEALYETIVTRLLTAAERGEVIYAVPGHPLVAERSVRLLQERASAVGQQVRIIAGMSFVEPVLTAVGLDPFAAGLQIVDAFQPDLDPFRPAIVGQLYDRRRAGLVKLALLERYPDEHQVALVFHAGLEEERVEWLPLYAIDRNDAIDHLTCLYLPPIPVLAGIGSERTFDEVVHRLRRDCPWDREQTHQSLRRYLIEETFEAVDALDSGDLVAYGHELGDVLLQVYLNAAIAEETAAFTIRDVYRWITAKLIRRHPHVFGDVAATTADQVEANWEKIKAAERADTGSRLDGVPRSMPALSLANALQLRAAKAGFTWETIEGVWAQFDEELAELRAAASADDRFRELGDVLWMTAQLARWYGYDAEEVLRSAADRFRRRFAAMEELARQEGRMLEEYAPDELRALWRAAKASHAR